MPRKIVAELVLSPRSEKSVSISEPLREAIKILQSYPGLTLESHAMGTNIECSDLDLLFDAVKKCHNHLIKTHPRVVTTLKIDERTDKSDHSIDGKKKAIKI